MPASRDRLTVTLRVTHQRFNREPKGQEYPFSRQLGLGDEEAYQRDPKVTEEWQPLDLGWCSDLKIAYIVISNLCDQPKPTAPAPVSEEEGTTEPPSTDDWLEVKFEDSVHRFYILQGEPLPILPSDAKALRIRIRKGSKRYRIFVIPE